MLAVMLFDQVRPPLKTRPDDAEKISLIRDIVAKHVNVKKIIESL